MELEVRRGARHAPKLTLVTLAMALAACAPNASSAAPSTAAGTSAPPAGSGAAPASGLSAERWCLDTAAEVSAAIGVKVSAPMGYEVPGIGGGCAYNDETGAPVATVAVFTSRAALSTFSAAQIVQGATPLYGVGDEAVLITGRGPLVIRAGNVVVSITVSPTSTMNDVSRLRAAFETLGRAAVQRIPPE
jgi:hypothetical protein